MPKVETCFHDSPIVSWAFDPKRMTFELKRIDCATCHAFTRPISPAKTITPLDPWSDAFAHRPITTIDPARPVAGRTPGMEGGRSV